MVHAKDGPGRLNSRSVVIVDEASMLTTADLDQLTARVHAAKAALVLVGDPAQIGAVNAPGGMFEHLCQRMGPWTIELTELHRFDQPWEGRATLRLRNGEPAVLADYAQHGRIHPAPSSADAADAVFEQWRSHTEAGRDALMLARSWADVTALNDRARAAAVATGAVTGPVLAAIASRTPSTGGHPQTRTWRAGDLLLAKKNTPHITVGTDTVRNGDRFRVLTTTDTGLVLQDLRGRGTTTLPTAYLARHAEYGWAVTIDGAQGATADVGIVLARSGLDREHLYVAMSRGRQENHVHTTAEQVTGDAGPHRAGSVAAATERRGNRPEPFEQLALAGTQPPTPVAAAGPQLADFARVVDRVPEPQRGPEDLQAAMALLSTAVSTSGRERAAHTLLNAPVHAVREQVWWQREAGRPPRSVPQEHRWHIRNLERARADLHQARALAQRLAGQLREQEEKRDGLPVWARRRRRDLTHPDRGHPQRLDSSTRER